MDGLDPITLFPGRSAADCIACHFSIERLLEALHGGTFNFCPQHMLRATAYTAEIVGEHHLTTVR